MDVMPISVEKLTRNKLLYPGDFGIRPRSSLQFFCNPGGIIGGAAKRNPETREMELRNPNIHFVASAKRDAHIESTLIVYQEAGEPFCRNIFFGSDASYGRVAWNFGGLRANLDTLKDTENHPDPRIRSRRVLFTDDAIQGYLGGISLAL
jgi:hypothetical protein